ncbi:MAG: glycoside hydrolase family 13 protein [Varibaculum cambriense]|nr:glycoside hydrolase family 13 protein [Varibaculum cambriense]
MNRVQRGDWDQWWRSAAIYQIYPRSFSDSNGDGIGDLAGVLDKIDYLEKLGIDAVWFSPFYPSPQHDTGYDVADYLDINPEYGDLETFDKVLAELHSRGMKAIIDVVPNHSSWDHPLFKQALAADPGDPARDMYMFRKCADTTPNNWGSMFGGSAWSKVEPLTGKASDRDWWYLHIFDASQPDFNWENPKVHEFFRSYLRFWLDRGVDGFRVDVAHGLVKDPALPDDLVGPDRLNYEGPNSDNGRALDVGPFFNQPGVHDIYREWRQVLDEYGRDRMLVAEAWVNTPEQEAMYVREDEMSQAFNFSVVNCQWEPAALRKVIRRTQEASASVGAPPTWVLSNHDKVRHVSRFGYPSGANTENGIGATDPQPDREIGLTRALSATAFLAGLPGSIYLYNGEELGLPDATKLPDEARQDPTWQRSGFRVRGRDGCRVPLPWSDDPRSNFGFSPVGASPAWLPQPDDWDELSVQVQEADPDSPLNFYRKMLKVRRDLGLGMGESTWLESDPEVLALQVTGSAGRQVVIVTNLGAGSRPLPEVAVGDSVKTLLATPGIGLPLSMRHSSEDKIAPGQTLWIEI